MKNSIFSLRDYLRLIFRRKWALVLPALAGILFVPFLWFSVPPKYQASALVRRKDLAINRSAPSSIIGQGSSQMSVNALRVEILTWNNLERVIRQVDLDTDLESPAEWQAMYSRLRNSISINTQARERGVDLIEISATDEDPEMAAAIANAVADNYVEASKKSSRADSQTAVDFLKDGTDEYLQKLRETENALEQYKKTHFSDLPSVKDNILSTLFQLRTEEAAQQLQLAKARSRLQSVEEQLQDVPRVVEGEVTSDKNPRWEELQNQLRHRKRVLTALLLEYTEKHPRVQQVQRELQDLEEQLLETPARVEGSTKNILNPEYQELQMKRRDLEQEIQALQAGLSQLDSRRQANAEQLERMVAEEKRYNDLVRDRQEANELYEQYRRSLVSARTRLEVESGQYGTQVEMISRALVPAQPYRLERVKLALASLVGGVALGVALMFGLEFSDRSLRNIEDAAAFLDLPVLGSVPTIVTEQEVKQRRRQRLAVGGTLLLLVVVSGVGIYVLEQFYPGTTWELLSKVYARLQGAFSSVTSFL